LGWRSSDRTFFHVLSAGSGGGKAGKGVQECVQ
jgi:hypothetical protein